LSRDLFKRPGLMDWKPGMKGIPEEQRILSMYKAGFFTSFRMTYRLSS
jgi:hypothetical protein